jgi:hypothetical protein
MLRRHFIPTLTAGALLPGAASAQLSAPRLWIDPKIAALPRRPWRKIHLDFHNSHHIGRIGERFDKDEFGDTLLKANVDSIVVFAKDMHGYFYYPSQYGPVHPGLDFDLLGAQVEACRQRKIAVYAYYCTAWDNYLAENHPEWLVFKRDRTTYLPKFDETPGWTALCLSHRDFVELEVKHTREFVGRYELDGAWFDMPIPINAECFCAECLRQLKSRGQDPFSRAVQCAHKQELHIAFLETLTRTVREVRPGCQVDYNNQGAYGLGARVAHQDNIDIEALPTTSGWGYYYFPLIVRYARTFGLTTYGMTGRFKASWADFGGLKQPVQLDIELAGIVAHAARCDIGDQMPPSARLDPAVYHVIGESYRRIRELEPYLDGAAPVTEAALLISDHPLERPNSDAHLGWVKLLAECRVQFDVHEPDAAWERYGLIVLPDAFPVTGALAERLHAYVAGGGALLVSHQAGLLAGTEKTWLERYGFRYAGMSPFQPAYLVPKEEFTGAIPRYEYALYQGASQWEASPPAAVVAQLGEPKFQRSAQHYTSHRQTPFDHETRYAAIARSGRVMLFGFPAGGSYFGEGYWVYRQAVQHALKTLLPSQLITSNAPLSTEITVTHQAAAAGRKQRYLIHLVNFSPVRGTPKHPVFHEDPIALTDVTCDLRLDLRAPKATIAGVPGGRVSVSKTGPGQVRVFIPRIPVSAIVALED